MRIHLIVVAVVVVAACKSKPDEARPATHEAPAEPRAIDATTIAPLSRADIFHLMQHVCVLAYGPADATAQARTAATELARRAGITIPDAPAATGAAMDVARARLKFRQDIQLAAVDALVAKHYADADTNLLIVSGTSCTIKAMSDRNVSSMLPVLDGAARATGLDPALYTKLADTVTRGAAPAEITKATEDYIRGVDAALAK